MTNFILVGGYPRKAADGGKAFAEALTSAFDEPIKLLVCLFARPEDAWEKAFSDDREFFSAHLPDKWIEFKCATKEGFLEELAWSDAVYFRGGDAPMLIKALAKQEGWRTMLHGKTVAGSSVGADMLTAHHYDGDRCRLADGLRLIPVKTLVHYRSDYNAPNIDWDEAERSLAAYGEPLKMVMLREGEFLAMRA